MTKEMDEAIAFITRLEMIEDNHTDDTPVVLGFAIMYKDDPESIEYGVRYEQKPYLYDESIIGFIELSHDGQITIPVTQIDWFIDKLQKIRDRI